MTAGDFGLAAIFALRMCLFALYGGALYAYAPHARDFVREHDPGDVLATGVWVIAAGALFSNINSTWVMLSDFGQFHGSMATSALGLSCLLAGYFLVLTAWASAAYDRPFRAVARRATLALAGAASAAFLGFLASLLIARA